MSLRHAAALALLGWYLMTPPLSYYSPEGSRTANGKAFHGWVVTGWKAPGVPDLPNWNTMSVHDTANQCQEALSTLELIVPSSIRDDPKGYAAILPLVKDDARCIASDDPRLAN